MSEHAEKPSDFPHSPNEEDPADFNVNEPELPVPSDDDEDPDEDEA